MVAIAEKIINALTGKGKTKEKNVDKKKNSCAPTHPPFFAYDKKDRRKTWSKSGLIRPFQARRIMQQDE